MSKKANFSMISLGCARTLVDSEHMIDRLQHGGFNLVAEGTSENITVLNTCSFIQSAIDETEANISALQEKKSSGAIKYLAVVGCYPSRFKKHVLELNYPNVDLWLNTAEAGQLQQQLKKLVFKKKYQPEVQKPYIKLTPSHFSYLKISEGCDNWCTFCTIPKIRGKHQSKSVESIIEEAERQIKFGAKELILIAEDTTAWGEDIYGKPNFPLLLRELGKLPVQWIRPMYIFPSRVDDALIQVIKETPNITNYIDMPVQHVSTDILGGMSRRHDRRHLEEVMKKFRQEIPDIAIRTSLLLGFPGETEENVNELLEFMEKYPFNHVGCFAYSEERETRSARFDNKVEENVIKSRIERVMDKQYEIVSKLNAKRVGDTSQLVYEGDNVGRTCYEAPDVDGTVFLENSEALVTGEFYSAKITESDGYDVRAEIV